jgi:hypothetical protein
VPASPGCHTITVNNRRHQQTAEEPTMAFADKSHANRTRPEPLKLYSFGVSAYARLVRGTLREPQVPCLLHDVGKIPYADFLRETCGS